MKESTSFFHEHDEWLPGQIVAIEETPDNGFGEGFKWVIQLDDQDEGDFDTWAFCSQTLSPTSKLYGWLLGLGANPDFGDDVETNDYVGRRVQVMFGPNVKKDGTATEKVVKIRAEKTQTPLQKKQGAAANAKKPPAANPAVTARDTTQFVNEDEAPF